MTITVETTYDSGQALNSGTTGAKLTHSFNHALQQASGANRFVILHFVGAANSGTNVIDNITYDGQAPTGTIWSYTSGSFDVRTYYWSDADLPATADTYTVTIDFDAESFIGYVPRSVARCVEIHPIDQATLVKSTKTAEYNFGTSQRTYTASGSLLVGFLGANSNYSATGGNPGASTNDTAIATTFATESDEQAFQGMFYATDGTVDATLTRNGNYEAWIAIALDEPGPQITSVGDGTLTVDETDIAIVGSGFTGSTASITDGTVTVEQTGYSITDDSNAELGSITRGNLPTSTSGRTLTVGIDDGSVEGTKDLTSLSVEATWDDVLVATPVRGSTSIYSLIESVHSITVAANDVCEWETNGSVVTIAADGVVTATTVPQTFDVRYWDESTNTLYAAITVTLDEAGEVVAGTSMINTILNNMIDDAIVEIIN